MVYTTRAISIYKLLHYAEQLGVAKKVLDCGAGRGNPPLYIFAQAGYITKGIDLSDKSIAEAKEFGAKYAVNLGISKGDMRALPFADSEFGCAYSYNTIFHMTKKEVELSIAQLLRVTEPGGLVFFNLLSKRDARYGFGRQPEPDTFFSEEEQEYHSFHDENEMDTRLMGCSILEKGTSHYSMHLHEGIVEQHSIEYYLRKD